LIGAALPFVLVAMVLGTILVLRWTSSHVVRPLMAPATSGSNAPAPAPAGSVPSPEQVAAAPHPAIEVEEKEKPNPPVTETGSRVVVEDPPTALDSNEPPPPAAVPRDPVIVAALSEPEAPRPVPRIDSAVESSHAVEPPPVHIRSSVPDWQRLAVAAPAAAGRPEIAVIIDDVGLDRRRSQKVIDLPGPLTISFMSYAEDIARQEAEARGHGHEIMMHVPMEPLDGSLDPGPGVLTDAQSATEIRQHLDADLAKFGGIVGINNHMGSKFTAFAPGMEVVMQDLRERGLLFIDSLTTEKSVGLAMARRYGVPSAARNVFLDDAGDLISVDFELGKLEEVARAKGNAIAIGHPRDATIAALSKWLPTLAAKGFVLVPVTAIVRARMDGETKTARH
jgi:polysaccharide deacetylase 2 family uncharacterized protein YibQ